MHAGGYQPSCTPPGCFEIKHISIAVHNPHVLEPFAEDGECIHLHGTNHLCLLPQIPTARVWLNSTRSPCQAGCGLECSRAKSRMGMVICGICETVVFWGEADQTRAVESDGERGWGRGVCPIQPYRIRAVSTNQSIHTTASSSS
jgi:hypothetical protein